MHVDSFSDESTKKLLGYGMHVDSFSDDEGRHSLTTMLAERIFATLINIMK
jgi:hypothetical protein